MIVESKLHAVARLGLRQKKRQPAGMDVAKAFEDKAPSGQELTAYDRTHIKLYMRLLDATD